MPLGFVYMLVMAGECAIWEECSYTFVTRCVHHYSALDASLPYRGGHQPGHQAQPFTARILYVTRCVHHYSALDIGTARQTTVDIICTHMY